ncbi:hypothetical protein GCM10020256_15820 [Streptomyces thermocoprophilus]
MARNPAPDRLTPGSATAVDWVARTLTEPMTRAAATPAARAFLRFIAFLPPGPVGERPQDVNWRAEDVQRQSARLWP